MQLGARADEAFAHLESITSRHRAQFIVCDKSAAVIAGKVTGHKQLTDAYPLEIAHQHQCTFSTLDTGIQGAELVQ